MQGARIGAPARGRPGAARAAAARHVACAWAAGARIWLVGTQALVPKLRANLVLFRAAACKQARVGVLSHCLTYEFVSLPCEKHRRPVCGPGQRVCIGDLGAHAAGHCLQ